MESRFEKILQALLNGETIDFEPTSRLEEYLLACINRSGIEGLPNPQSRADVMLLALAEEMANGGGGSSDTNKLPPEAYIIEGECQNRLANGIWDWYITYLGKKITTRNLTDINGMFLGSKVEEIPFALNSMHTDDLREGIDAAYIFYNCENLKSVPKLNIYPHRLNWVFSGCKNLREIPDDIESQIDWRCIEGGSGRGNSARQGTFDNCYSLRKFPMGFLNHAWKWGISYDGYFNDPSSVDRSIYNSLFNRNCSLDEIVGLPVPYEFIVAGMGIEKVNIFTNTFFNCNRVKRVTFDTSTFTDKFRFGDQIIDLSLSVGHAPDGYAWRITDYNSGITADKEVKDDTTYQALKNDPDWFTCNPAYSRYNHDSAVETINSLPPTYGINTIKFLGAAGSKTDGGAISNLTKEEIAVATSKGWTVTLI